MRQILQHTKPYIIGCVIPVGLIGGIMAWKIAATHIEKRSMINTSHFPHAAARPLHALHVELIKLAD